MRENFRHNLLFSLLLGAGILILGFSFSALIYFVYASTGTPITWKQAWSVGLTQWWVWCFLYWSVYWLVRRFPIERNRWLKRSLAHIAIGLIITVLKLGIDVVWIKLFNEATIFNVAPERSLLAIMLYFNFITYGAIVGITHALDFYKRMRERELRASQLEAQLAQAELQALKMQLHPHFLFNTLHTIAMLNLKDSKAANRMISRLSDLLRITLDNAGVQEVPLKQELDFLKRYLEIEQIRFQDRLSVHLDIDSGVLDARVPNLILQPLVENALRHGVADREADGRIEISAARRNGWLQLSVRDNGHGMAQKERSILGSGIGIKNTRSRLEQLYGNSHNFELKNGSDGGLEATVAIPFREQ